MDNKKIASELVKLAKSLLAAAKKLPYVKAFDDYHLIEEEEEKLRYVLGTEVKSKEVAFDGMYYGLFFVGGKPSEDMVMDLLKKAGFKQKPNSQLSI